MPEPTTTRELEDWHARRAGWACSPDGIWSKPEWGDDHVRAIRAGCLPRHDHPIATTIDAAVLALPEGCRDWTRSDECVEVYAKGGYVHVQITGNTPEAIRRDLLALARLAWIAEGRNRDR